MKKFLSTIIQESAFNLAVLLLRLSFGLDPPHRSRPGQTDAFGSQETIFFDPFHIGHRWSLVLVISPKFFARSCWCWGLFTRFAALVLVISMATATVLFHKGQSLSVHEPSLLYLTAFLLHLLVGPGRSASTARWGNEPNILRQAINCLHK